MRPSKAKRELRRKAQVREAQEVLFHALLTEHVKRTSSANPAEVAMIGNLRSSNKSHALNEAGGVAMRNIRGLRGADWEGQGRKTYSKPSKPDLIFIIMHFIK